MIFSTFWGAVLGTLSGCNSADRQPPAVLSNLRLTPDEQRARLVLDDQEQRRAREIMTSVAGDHRLGDPPAPAELGMRWRDVPIALYYACNEVEMAIIQTIKEKDRYIFKLKTLDDRPGEIIISRLNDARVYEARVSIGRFNDDQAKVDQLLEEFDRQLKLFGNKRAFAEEDD